MHKYLSRDVKFFEDIFSLHSIILPLIDSSSTSFLPTNSKDTRDQDFTTIVSISHSIRNPPEPNNVSLKRSTRVIQPPSHLRYYVCNYTFSECNSHSCHHTITNYRLHDFSDQNPVSVPTSYTFNAISHVFEPSFYHQAKGHPEWEQAMANELKSLEDNQTWDVVKLPKGKKPISCRWVYKVKYRADGTLERHKARLVAKGFTQKEGIDFHETFSPVVKFTTIRCIVALAVKKNWPIHQFDVNNGFLHGDLHEEVYMKPPLGFNILSPSLVCKLKKSLYGLRQVSRQWYFKLSTTLRSKGYYLSQNDHSVFLKNTNTSLIVVAVYVDDILVTGNDSTEINSLKAFLHNQF